MRRICLFAGYDKNNKIQDYVTYMVKKLADVSEVYYAGNGQFGPDELIKIAPYTQMFYSKQFQKRDFGAWLFLIHQLGWDRLAQYDELILCNDSVYGPLMDLETVFNEMEYKGYDFWSMTSDYQAHFYLHRYFMVFSRDVVLNEKFHNFWKAVPFEYDSHRCEMELTPLLVEQGFVGNSYIRNFTRHNVLETPEKVLDDYPLPFVKVKSFLPENNYSSGSGIGLRYKIRRNTDYDVGLINRNISENRYPQTLGQRFAAFTGF